MSIEELAFKDRKILANLNAIDLLDIIEFLQEDRNQWINQFTKTHNEGVEIQKENQELKKQLENKYEKVGTLTSELLYEENTKLIKENQDLKKQLENCYCNRTDCSGRIKDSKKYDSLIQAQEVQQKEFINYLQKEINQHTAHIDAINSYGISIYSPDYDNSKLKLAIFKEVLLKYIETIQTKIDKSV